MSKYIDAEKLIDEIERFSATEYGGNTFGDDVANGALYYVLEEIIPSLQQEQTDCHTVEDWIQHIKNADQLTKDVFSKGPYDVLYNALNHPYQHCYDAIKEFGELCFQVGVNSVKQEQQEVDLSDEIKNYFKGFYMDLTDQGYILKNSDGSVGLMSVKDIARHFYELGKNSK